MSRKIVRKYAIYWRNPQTRQFEKLTGAKVAAVAKKPRLIESDDATKFIYVR